MSSKVMTKEIRKRNRWLNLNSSSGRLCGEILTEHPTDNTRPVSRPIFVLFKQGAYTGSENKTQSSQPVLIHFKGMLGDKKWQREKQWMVDRSQTLGDTRKMSTVHIYACYHLMLWRHVHYCMVYLRYMYSRNILRSIYCTWTSVKCF